MFTVSSLANVNQETSNRNNVDSLNKYIPENYRIYYQITGHLNEDTLSDVALMIYNPDEMDSKSLIVLLKQSNDTFAISLETTDFISIRYSTDLVISNRILHIKTDDPWHGENFNSYDLKFINSDWFCMEASFSSFDSDNEWKNKLNYETGLFEIKHTVYLKDQMDHDKEIKGILKGIKPFSATKDDFSNSLTINYNGKDYYINGRCDLWTEDEIIEIEKSIKETGLESINFNTSLLNKNTVTDIDGNIYKTVTIGSQIWMAENLKTTHYADGAIIPLANTKEKMDALTDIDKAYCWYNNDSITNGAVYGALYTWAAAMNGESSSESISTRVQGVCPAGWHLPSVSEFIELEEFSHGSAYAGDKLKEVGTKHWRETTTSVTNETGFTGLPGGYSNGSFSNKDLYGYWWSTNICDSNKGTAYALNLTYNRSSSNITNHDV